MEPTRSRGRVSSAVRPHATSTPANPHAPQHPKAALRALHTALARLDVPPTAREVAAALWSHTDAAGRCWPSQRTLARLTGRSERTVRSAVKALAAAGVFLRDVPALRDRRRARRTTAYRFTLGFPLVVPAGASTGRAEASMRGDAPSAEVAPAPPPAARRPDAPVEVAPHVADGGGLDGEQLGSPVDVDALEHQVDAPELVDRGPLDAGAPELLPVEVPALDDAPALAFDGFALVAFDGEGLDDAPREDASPAIALDASAPELPPAAPVEARPSPATAAAPSPATAATRRPQEAKTPPTPTHGPRELVGRRVRAALPHARPPLARCEPVGALVRPWTSEALAAAAARMASAARRGVRRG